MARNVARTSAAVTPGTSSAAKVRAGRRPAAPRDRPHQPAAERRQRRLVHLRVLPQLERRQVEPERLDLPAEVLDSP
jgi:hypothetical protein